MLQPSEVAKMLAAGRAMLRRSRSSLWLRVLALSLSSTFGSSACTEPIFIVDAASEAGTENMDGGSEPEGLTPPDGGPENQQPCSGRACAEEAGTGPERKEDAGASEGGSDLPGDAGLDEVRAKWAGRYATRSAVFSFDDPIKSSGKLLSIVAIVPSADGGLSLQEELCYFEGGGSFLFTAQLQYKFVDSHLESALQYDKDTFESELAKVQIGYGPTPSGCRSGATLPKSDEQVWLTSTCDCPLAEDMPPTSARDCRVTDEEGDRMAGATFSATLETSSIVYRTTQEERLRLAAGYRIGDRLYAERVFEDTTRVLDCSINGRLTPASSCPTGTNPRPCASTHNKVELVPIDAGLSCSQVIAQEQGLFLKPLPGYPQACPAEVAGAALPGRTGVTR